MCEVVGPPAVSTSLLPPDGAPPSCLRGGPPDPSSLNALSLLLVGHSRPSGSTTNIDAINHKDAFGGPVDFPAIVFHFLVFIV